MAEYLSDIEIAQQARMLPITEVAAAFTALESRATTGKIILEH